MWSTQHRSRDELEAALPTIRRSPADEGTLEMIVRRPAPRRREVVAGAHLDPDVGLHGDSWLERGSRHTEDGSAEVERQLTLMNARAVDAVAGERDRWSLAGDQLYVDLDLSEQNLPPGSRLRIGDAEVEVSAVPHTGCLHFTRRFGRAAARFVNSAEGRALNLRGINAFVVTAGRVQTADPVVVASRPLERPADRSDANFT